MLATARFPALATEAFIAGLIHNLGVVIQATVDPSGTAAMIAARKAQPQRPIRELESAYAAIRHEDAIAAVFESWQLPHSLVAVALHHHEPLEAPEEHRGIARLVGMGAELALACGSTYSLEPAAHDGAEPALHVGTEQALRIGVAVPLTEPELGAIRNELPRRLSQLLAALG
jgi:HD-like signal output (HDOD) protein